jgi:hypothetical protein
MDVSIGSRIAVETERVGQRERVGEVLEIIEHRGAVSYRVRWDDGHVSIFHPASGAVRVLATTQ